MWKARILGTYLVREVVLYGSLGIAGVCLVFLAANLRHFLDELIGVGFGFADVLALLRCLLGMVAPYVVPIAFLLGVLLTLGRKAGDREVTAMHACGLGLGSLVVPTMALGCVVSGLTWYLALEVEHTARRDLRVLVKNLATRATRLPPGEFSKLGPRVIYVQDSDGGGRLQGVLISDRSDAARPLLIFAEEGWFRFDETESRFAFHLEDGDVHVEPVATDPDLYRRISFRSIDYSFDASYLFAVPTQSYRRYDMSLTELRSLIVRAEAGDPLTEFNSRDTPVDYALEIYRRFALPVAPMLFALVAVPLGTRVRRGGRSWGSLLAVLIAFAYYAIVMANENLAREGVLAPGVALWVPNLAFAALGAVLLYRARRPKS